MEERIIDINEKKNDIKWFQYSQHIYFSREGNPDIEISYIQEIKPESKNLQLFQKIGDKFDIGYHNGEFVLCKNRDSLKEQAFVSFETIKVDFGICQKIPSRNTFILNDKTVKNLIKKEKEAINLLTQSKKQKNTTKKH